MNQILLAKSIDMIMAGLSVWGVIFSTLSKRLESVGKSIGGDAGIRAIGAALEEAEREITKTLKEAK